MRFEAGDEKGSMTARGLTFDAILNAPVLDFIVNHSRPEQRILIVQLADRAVAVPCKPLPDGAWLLVTAYPSRKFTKRYLHP